MPDEYLDLNSTGEAKQRSSGEEKESSWWIGRWAHMIAGLVFCLLYLPLSASAWSWQVAITLAYMVFMLCCTCGLSFSDSDDLLGNPPVVRYMGLLLIRQIFVLALISLWLYLWHYLIPHLPDWFAARGRRLSLWDFCGILLTYLVAVREATWMAKQIKKRFPELRQPLDSIESEQTP
jgi:hypothetical protein